MADTVTSQIIENGPRWLVMRFTGVSDGTGETGVKKVDAQSATFAVNIQGQLIVPGVHLKVREIEYDVAGERLEIQWDATTPETMLVLGGFGTMKFDRFGGLSNPGVAALPGATGSILFTTLNAALDSTYSVVLRLSKGVPNGSF